MIRSPFLLGVIGLALLGCGPLGSRFAVTPTSTPAPSTTPSPTQTPTQAPTPMATQTALPNTFFKENSDGSRTFVDVEYGYSITFPDGWLTFEFTEGEIAEVLAEVADLMPGLDRSVDLTSIVSEGMRLAALPLDPGYFEVATPPNINIIVTEWPANLSMEFVLSLNAQALPQIFESAEVLKVDQETNATGLEQGTITYTVEYLGAGGAAESLFGSAAIYHIGNFMVTVTGGVSGQLSSELEPVFQGVFEGVGIID